MSTILTERAQQPASLEGSRVLSFWVGAVVFAGLTAIGAKISVPLPWTPVPGTLQPLALLLAGAFLGSRGGAASQVIYLMTGLAGLPVFALPGAGPAYFLGPTAGYLLGFVPAAWLAGRVIEARRHPRFLRCLAGALSGAMVLHLCGAVWIALLLRDPAGALAASLKPFILFDLSKACLAAALRAGWSRRAGA